MSVALFGLATLFGLAGLTAATAIAHVTSTLRAAELAAITVATRDAAGFPRPCEPAVPEVVACTSSDGVATVSVVRAGVRASAIAGPEG